MCVFLQKVQKHVHRKPCAQMFTAAWFIRTKGVQMYIHYEWINKMWSIHTVEYYLAIKNNQVAALLQYEP